MDREYPQFDYCYCDSCVAHFKAQTGIDIRQVKTLLPFPNGNSFVTIRSPESSTDWPMPSTKKENDIGSRISGPSIAKNRAARWDKWNLDAFYPMNYNDFYLEDVRWIGKITKEEVKAVKGRSKLYSGLFICPNPANKS